MGTRGKEGLGGWEERNSPAPHGRKGKQLKSEFQSGGEQGVEPFMKETLSRRKDFS